MKTNASVLHDSVTMILFLFILLSLALPTALQAADPAARRAQLVGEFREKFANPYVAAAYGYIDAVIEPAETRSMLLHALQISMQKQEHPPKKKHGIPPF